jgi:hypothetical protein
MVDMGPGLRRENQGEEALLNHPMHPSTSYAIVSTASAIPPIRFLNLNAIHLEKHLINRVQKLRLSQFIDCRLARSAKVSGDCAGG